jgi:VanZ family protein
MRLAPVPRHEAAFWSVPIKCSSPDLLEQGSRLRNLDEAHAFVLFARTFRHRHPSFRPGKRHSSWQSWQADNMFRALLSYATPLLSPTNRVRMQCLLLQTTLVVALLYVKSHPDQLPVNLLPWMKLANAAQYGVLAALSWVVMGGRSPSGALVLAGSIALLDEGVKYYSPVGTAGFGDVVADLLGAAVVVLVLSALKAAGAKRTPLPSEGSARERSPAGTADGRGPPARLPADRVVQTDNTASANSAGAS